MKFVAIFLAAAFVTFFLQKAAAQTDRQPAMTLPPPFIILTNQNFQLSKTDPLLLDDAQSAQPLKPGIYQTYPYAMTLVVPKPVNDDCKMESLPHIDSTMPVLRPKIEIVPQSSVAD
jgi:hypothetical protein